MTAIEVVALSGAHEPAYAGFVAAHPDALISYTLPYRDLLTGMLGCEARYAVALRDGAVAGVLPLMSLDGELGTVLNSLPYFGSNGGPLAGDAQAAQALGAWYAEQAHRDGVLAATVIENPFATVAAAPAGVVHDLVDHRVAHVTPLDGDGDAEARILATIDSSARRNAMKAERLGTQVEVHNDGFDVLQSLHRASMEAIGAQVKAPEFFEAVPRLFTPRADYDLYVARTNGEAVAALLVFYCARTVDYYVPAVSPDHRGDQPMAAVLRRAMSDAARRGLTRWNWGGSWPTHESLQRFKAKWGGVKYDYRYETKLNDEKLLRRGPQEILRAYPGFFVAPFSALKGDT